MEVMEETSLPVHPFFSCDTHEFAIVDGEEVKHTVLSGPIEPWITFQSGPGNIFEGSPRQVVGRDGDKLSVECDDGTVHLDFDAGNARKSTPLGEFVYLGGIDERNDGKGYIPLA